MSCHRPPALSRRRQHLSALWCTPRAVEQQITDLQKLWDRWADRPPSIRPVQKQLEVVKFGFRGDVDHQTTVAYSWHYAMHASTWPAFSLKYISKVWFTAQRNGVLFSPVINKLNCCASSTLWKKKRRPGETEGEELMDTAAKRANGRTLSGFEGFQNWRSLFWMRK